MRKPLIAIFLILVSSWVKATEFEDRFAVVLVDANTEKRYGSIPLRRAYLAQAVQRIAKSGAKGVVLKFFLDRPKDKEEDQQLATAFSKIPVLLEARIDDSEPNPNPLPKQFSLPIKGSTAIAGTSGWIPLPIFAEKASGIGFVDFAGTGIPIIEQYQNATVKSLVLASIELAEGSQARISPGTEIVVGKGHIKVDSKNQAPVRIPKDAKINYVAFHDLLEGAKPNVALKGKVVILAYDGPHIHTLETPVGSMGAHRYFISTLKTIYDDAFANTQSHTDAGRRR